jgi:hypothetical protein
MDNDEKIIKKLYNDGKISKEELQNVLKIHQANKAPLEKLVIKLKLVSREDAVAAKASVLNAQPYLLDLHKINTEIAKVLPEEIAKKYNMVCPGETKDGKIIVAMNDPGDGFAYGYVQMKTGREIQPFVSLLADLEEALDALYGGKSEKENKLFFSKNAVQERKPQKVIPQKFSIPGLSRTSTVVTAETPLSSSDIGKSFVALKEASSEGKKIESIADPIFYEMKNLEQLTILATELNSPMDEREMLTKILETGIRLCSAEDGSILMLDKEKQSLFFKEVLGKEREKLLGTEVSLSAMSIAGWVAINKTPLAVNNAKEDSRHYKEIDKKVGFETRNLACVPIKWGNTVLGVLELVNKHKGDFVEKDLQHLKVLAAQAAVVLHNNIIFDQLDRFYTEVLDLLIDSLNTFDPEGKKRRYQVAQLASAIAGQLNLPDIQYINISYAASLMDIGRMRTTEKNLIEYPVIGAEMLSMVDLLKPIAVIIKYQNEKNDGSGYPESLSGESIPLGARILAIAKGYVQTRIDNPGIKEDELLAKFMGEFESLYDPGLKLVFLSVVAVKFGGKLPED